jgi:hypothetical protein
MDSSLASLATGNGEFLEDAATTYDSKNEGGLSAAESTAFAHWGGEDRLDRCVAVAPRS